jgi:hypothetical protein
MADLMVHHRSLAELFHDLAQVIQKVVDFQLLNFSLHNPRHNQMDMHLWEGELVSDFPTQVPVAESARRLGVGGTEAVAFARLEPGDAFSPGAGSAANTLVPNLFHDAVDDGGAASGRAGGGQS